METRNRFLDKIQYEPTTGCWLWMGSYFSRSGRPQYHWRAGNEVLAQRVSYCLFKGSIPRTSNPHDTEICHTCDTIECVNPDHLWLGTSKQNTQDMLKKGRQRKAKFKSHCCHGHPFNSENLYVCSKGYRYCRLCANISKKSSALYKARHSRSRKRTQVTSPKEESYGFEQHKTTNRPAKPPELSHPAAAPKAESASWSGSEQPVSLPQWESSRVQPSAACADELAVNRPERLAI